MLGAEPEHLTRSWCPSCKAYLLGGVHFKGRHCGTCHTETIPAVMSADELAAMRASQRPRES
jgi:hypothetical protein